MAFAAIAAVLFALAVVISVSDRLRFGSHDGAAEPIPLRIDINRADAATLRLLPGIGPGLAGRIIAGRTDGGPFIDTDDLRIRVKGIGPKTAERIAPHVTFDTQTDP